MRVPAGTAAGVLVTDDDWLAGLWRLHGGAVRTVAELAQALEQEGVNVRVAIAPDASGGNPEAELGRLEHGVFAPLRTALLAQKIRVIDIHRGDAIVQVGASATLGVLPRPRPLAESRARLVRRIVRRQRRSPAVPLPTRCIPVLPRVYAARGVRGPTSSSSASSACCRSVR